MTLVVTKNTEAVEEVIGKQEWKSLINQQYQTRLLDSEILKLRKEGVESDWENDLDPEVELQMLDDEKDELINFIEEYAAGIGCRKWLRELAVSILSPYRSATPVYRFTPFTGIYGITVMEEEDNNILTFTKGELVKRVGYTRFLRSTYPRVKT